MLEAIDLFDSVIPFPFCRTRLDRLKAIRGVQKQIRAQSYEVVLDLQGNWVSRFLRMIANPLAWSEFDRVSPEFAASRVAKAFLDGGFPEIKPSFNTPLRREVHLRAEELLMNNGWNPASKVLLLNPAGLWVTRQWPDESYLQLAHLFTSTDSWQILFMGTERIHERVERFLGLFRDSAINLVGKTTLGEALAVLQRVSLVISEDSGLMHMAWISGVPTIAIFGSSRHDWSSPVGNHSRCLHSGDLPCGACMSPVCRYGDVHCLTRFSPSYVFDVATSLLAATAKVRH
jgi:ADP-heptose:LPS heptosyltransferase